MSNTILQIRRSTTNTVPSSLANGELAYSGNASSNSLFIGHPDGTTGVIRIAGGKYPWLNNSNTTNPGTQTANAVVITDANSFTTNTYTQGLVIQGSGSVTTPAINAINAVSNSTVLGLAVNTELTTTWAIKNYVDLKSAVGAPGGSNTQVQFNNSGTLGGTAALTWINTTNSFNLDATSNFTVGNSTVNVYTNSTSFNLGNTTSNTSINSSYIDVGNSTINVQINTSAVSFAGGNTVNNTIYGGSANYLGGAAAAAYVNTSGAFTLGGVLTHNANLFVNGVYLIVGNSTSNVTTNTTSISFSGGNTINATVYTGSASYLGGALASVYVNTSGAFTLGGVLTHNANLFVNAAYMIVGNSTANVTTNTTSISFSGGNTINATVYSGSASYLGGAAASVYVNTSGAFTLTGVQTFNANVGLAGNSTSELLIGTTGANVIANGSTVIVQGNTTQNAVMNSTGFYINGTAVTTLSSVNTAAQYTWSNTHTFNANVTIAGNSTAELIVGGPTGGAANGVVANATTIAFGNATTNATINTTVYSGTANNATNLGGAAASVYVNTSGAFTMGGVLTENANLFVNAAYLIVGNSTANVTTNTTSISFSGGNTINATVYTGSASYLGGALASVYVNTSGAFTLGGVITENANLIVNAAYLIVGNSTANVTTNTTTISFSGGNTINATIYSGQSLTSNNATNLGGAAASVYVNTSGTFTIAGVITHNANLALVGNSTAELLIGSTGANVVANGSTVIVQGNTTQNAVMNSTGFFVNGVAVPVGGGTFSNGTAYTWSAVETYNSNVFVNAAYMIVGNSTANVTTNTTTISFSGGNTINATIYSGQSLTSNNATNLGGAAASVYVNTSGAFTLSGVQTFNANVSIVGNSTAELIVGGSGTSNGVIINSTVISVGNSTINVQTTDVGTTYGNATVYTVVNSTIINTSGTIVATGMTLSGNLTVTGSTNYVNTTNIQIADNFIRLADNNSISDTADMAWFGQGNSVYSSFTGTLTNANNWITTLSINPVTVGITAGMIMAGPAVPANWTVTSVNSTVIVMTGNFTGTTNVGASVNATSQVYYGFGRIASNNTFEAFSTLTLPSGTNLTSPVAANAVFNGLGLGTPLAVGSGGTGLNTLASQSLLVGNVAGAMTAVAVGTAGNVLQVNNSSSVAWGGIDCGAF